MVTRLQKRTGLRKRRCRKRTEAHWTVISNGRSRSALASIATRCRLCTTASKAPRCINACSNCTQSKWCRDCQRISHSQLSRACDDSSYITLCVGCESCVHCFACVAMQGGEFCILNEKVGRKEYQTRVAELRALLERRLAERWRPEWLRDEEEPVEAPIEVEAPRIVEPVREPVRVEPPREEITVKRAAPVREPGTVEPTTRAGGPSVTRGTRPSRGTEPSVRSSVVAARRPPRG